MAQGADSGRRQPGLLAKFGSVIVQIHPREATAVTLERLEEYDRRRYGSVLLIFYAAAEDLVRGIATTKDEMEAWDTDDELSG